MKKINVFNVAIIVSCVLLILLVSVIFGYSFCSKSLIVTSTRQMSTSYYLVEVAKFDDYDSAQIKSQRTMEQGGAGFIFYDDGFRVFLSGYVSNDDAKKVAEKNGGEVYELKLASYDFGQKSNQTFKNNLLSFKNCIETLNKLILLYQTGEMNETDVKTNCLMLSEQIDMQQEKFETIFYESSAMYHYRNYLCDFKNCFNTIIGLDSTGVDFVRIVHYQQISAMICLRNMLSVL